MTALSVAAAAACCSCAVLPAPHPSTPCSRALPPGRVVCRCVVPRSPSSPPLVYPQVKQVSST
ncbi:hypothetical protein BDA96_08G090400 [Sorghum bicolor]|uniref:Secreted protein n=1 Tax=Sorghum bicolor TaxID=4558 RepID=A0A921QF82_SORBI|nr:hypothetical protein BDA96_08G090400 [Sorghum bicolor]